MPLEELQNGRYRYLRMLGSGGMGEVRLMEDVRVSRQVAIKVIRTESNIFFDQEKNREAARLFQREARAIAALEHPNILPLYDFGEEVQAGTTITYMVMPFCAEGSLANWLKQPVNAARLLPSDIAHLIEQAADALQYAHEQHIIHLDVKPSNFLLRSNRKRPSRLTLLLADFGIARSFTTISSSSRTIRGTPTSMAPEQWSGGPVPATDQYALSVMAYEMLTGRPPFVGTMEQLMYRHFTAEAPAPSTFNAQLPAAIDSVLLRALLKKPEDRFPSITDFATALGEAMLELPDTPVLAAVQTISTEDSQEKPLSSDEIGLDHMMSAMEDNEVEEDEPTRIAAHAGRLVSTPDLDQPPPSPPAVVFAASGEEVEEEGVAVSKKAAQSQKKGSANGLEPAQLSARSVAASSFEQSEAVLLASESVSSQAERVGARLESRLLSGYASKYGLSAMSLVAPGARKLVRAVVRRPLFFRALSAALIVVLLAVCVGSAVYLMGITHQHNPQSNSTASKPVQTVVTQPTHIPTATPTPTPQSPGLYMAGKYNGSLSEQSTYTTKQISVLIEQSKENGVITGSVTFVSSQAMYALNGSVDLQGKFSFSIPQSTGQLPLYFFGNTYQQNGKMYLRGNFCSTSTNTCASSDGYFTVGPQQP